MDKRKFLIASVTAAMAAAGYSKSAGAQGAPGQRAKLVFMLSRKPGTSFAEFSRYWRENHAPIGSAMPGVRRYIQNHIGGALDGTALPYDGYTEMWFDDMGSMLQALQSPEAQAAIDDSENFLDVEKIQTFVVEEVQVV